MESNDPQIGNTRKPYKKPEAKRFSLRAEEAVLGFCKSATAGGGPATGNATCRNTFFCSSSGS